MTDRRGERDQQLLDAYRGELERMAERKAKQARFDQRRAKERDPRRRHRAQLVARVDLVELRELRNRPAGPNLPQWAMRNPREHVQGADVDPYVADGWGVEHRAEFRRIARRAGCRPLLVGMLHLLSWAHGFKGGALGCGIQAPAAWWARKLGCHRSHVYRLFAELEERELGRHFAQLRTYARATADIPALHFKDGNGHSRPLRRWRSADGRLRSRFDAHGVTYATHAGVRVLKRRPIANRARWIRSGRPVGKSGASCGLFESLSPLTMHVRRRLAAGVGEEETPNRVNQGSMYVSTGLGRSAKGKEWPSATDSIAQQGPWPGAPPVEHPTRSTAVNGPRGRVVSFERFAQLDAAIARADLEQRHPWR